MKVKELISKLSTMDQEADVLHLWDGELRTEINNVYMGKTGLCITADCDEVAYSDEARPEGAPSRDEDCYWKTGKQRESPTV